MGENLPCTRHEFEIANLSKRIDDMEDLKGVLHSLDKNFALQSQLLQQMSERNDRQDERMNKQDSRMNEYQEVMVKVSTNLSELSEGQRLLNQSNKDLGHEVKDLKQKVQNSEAKHLIDIRDINKKENIGTLEKYGKPFGFGIAIGTVVVPVVIEIVKVLK